MTHLQQAIEPETSEALASAVQFLLREARCGYNQDGREVYTFEEESEIHAVLVEALAQSNSCNQSQTARIAV